MTFRVGQKVVFIGPDMRSHGLVVHFKLSVPLPQSIYTIRQYTPRVEGEGYLLREILNAEHYCPLNGSCEIAINADWLRPLVERKTDISIFTEMLVPAKGRQLVS